MRVLVLEDHEDRHLLHSALGAFGVEVLPATTCAEAAIIVDEGIDAALINLEVIGGDDCFGLATAEYIREGDRTTPIVGYMSEDNPFVRVMCRHLNVRDAVKPMLSITECVAYFREKQPTSEHSGLRERCEAESGTRERESNVTSECVEGNRQALLRSTAIAVLGLGGNLRQTINDLEDCAIEQVLEANGGKLRPTALALGIDRRSLQYRLRQRKR
jgi:DNA-binding response OmpR family regulator